MFSNYGSTSSNKQINNKRLFILLAWRYADDGPFACNWIDKLLSDMNFHCLTPLRR